MRVIAFIGSSGTGKSYQAIELAKKKNIAYIIDDGLLIKGNKVLGGFSAKKESSRLGAIKRALFMDMQHQLQIKQILKKEAPKALLVLGTSEKMVNTIANALELGEFDERIYIEEIVTEEEIKIARKYRKNEGKHVVPVPIFEIKKHFSGYFLNPLKVLRNLGLGGSQEIHEKSVVRPTFSYMGKYTISDRVIKDLIHYVASKSIGIYRVNYVKIENMEDGGLNINISINAIYGNPLIAVVKEMQRQMKYEIEEMTSFYINQINVFVKTMV